MKNLRSNIFLMINLLVLCTILFISHIPLVFTEDVAVAATRGRCIASERQALLEFRASLIDKANRLSSWTGDDCCNWVGITCNNFTSHIEKLDLRNPIELYSTYHFFFDDTNYAEYNNNCLTGEINPSISDLKHLRYLDLSSNNFSGIPIPIFFGSLRNLRYLNLSNAQFTGEIPPHIGNLSNLKYLYLGQSDYVYRYSPTGLSAYNLNWITRLVSLKDLDLSRTSLSDDWLDCVNMLSSLSSLTLRSLVLPFGTIPLPNFHFNLTSLVSLDMGENYHNPSMLRFFNLTAINLQVLRLDESYGFGGPIPFLLQKFTSLYVLDISWNQFNSSISILDSLCNCTNIVYVDLSRNQFEESLPLCLANLTTLEVLNLRGNGFSGKISNELGNLKKLTSLYLSVNDFNSSIPLSFGKLTNLRSLSLENNWLYGTVPPTLGNLTRLQELSIGDTVLTGELSESIFRKLKDLKYLYFSDFSLNFSSQWIPPFQLSWLWTANMTTDQQFPHWLQNQRNIPVLGMINASICGAIPEWFGTIGSSTVKVLILPYNRINGSIPNFLCNFSSLTTLDLSQNQLTGRIPLCLGSLWQLRLLSLSGNKLNGVVPPSLKNLTFLYWLNLSKNQFTGTISEWIGKELSQLSTLQLQSNNFSGMLPLLLQNLTSLQWVDISENQFTDTVPEWMGELIGLRILKLQSNQFYGNIPTQLCKLVSLRQLKLGDNKLTGYVPDCSQYDAAAESPTAFDDVAQGPIAFDDDGAPAQAPQPQFLI